MYEREMLFSFWNNFVTISHFGIVIILYVLLLAFTNIKCQGFEIEIEMFQRENFLVKTLIDNIFKFIEFFELRHKGSFGTNL